ncbi:flagellar motor protein MotB [Clostridium sp. FP1]|uniref:flagellar motor protein MotB n=1 Tax=Clostridium sp. FP1 TaxID=2724076 RepID=UPI0013E9385D|nr:flagellar motor protein MotB [Clostridium sp. FP1]MBZ9633926.1 OmpA family protein [Clostridium sp. FP1]
MKKREEKEPNHERWLLTYSDLITLLMIFFVIMYASSTVSATKYKQLSQSLNVAFEGGGKSIVGNDSAISITDSSTKVVETPSVESNSSDGGKALEESKMKDIKKNVDKYLKENGLSSNVSTKIDERGLQVSLNSTLLFDVGKAEVKAESIKQLISIGKILNKVDNYVRIEGHTDSTPISNNEFSSNWQLSAIRATNVTELLISKSGIYPKRISAVAYGENRPVANNTTEIGKSKNRTVDIIILSSKFSKAEKTK